MMEPSETIFKTLSSRNEGSDAVDSMKGKELVTKDEIIKPYKGNARYTEGKKESPAVCQECIQSLNFKINHAVKLCFRCNEYLCHECAEFHFTHMPQKYIDSGTNQEGIKQTALRQFKDVYKELNLESNITLTQSLSSNKTNILGRIDIHHSADWKEECWIRDICVLDNGFVAITENQSESLKLFDKNHEFIRRIQLQTWPCGVVQIPKKWIIDQVPDSPLDISEISSNLYLGITLPTERKIITLDLDSESGPGLVVNEIKVESAEEFYTFWLLFHDGLFITMCQTKPPTCHFITMSGISLKVIDLYFDTFNVTDWYPRIAINQKTDTIYVSSYDDNLVFSMDLCGELLNRTTKTVLENGKKFVPYGITVDEEDNVYVCSEEDSTIYKFSPNLDHSEVFVDESLCRIDSPGVIVASKRKFYVSHDTDLSDIVTVISAC